MFALHIYHIGLTPDSDLSADRLFLRRFFVVLKEPHPNHLTKPERQNAWYYYDNLHRYERTPMELVRQKREELIQKLEVRAQEVIDRFPANTNPNTWNDAAEWLDKAYAISKDKMLLAKQSYCAAMSLFFSGDAKRAEKESDIALNTMEENQLKAPRLFLRIAQFYKRLKIWDKARRVYKLAVDTDPELDWLIEFSEVLIEVSDLTEAEAQLRKAHKIAPDHALCLRLLAGVLLRSDSKDGFAEALEIAKRAHEIKPDDIDTEEVYAWALLKSGNPSLALRPLRRVAQHRLLDDNLRDEALLRLSQAYSQSGDLGRSISALREAEARGSQSVEIYDELGKRLAEKGDLEGAITAAERAASLIQGEDQKKAKRLRNIAEYLERTGRLADAAYKYKDAARLDKDVKINTSLENHAKVLFHRAGQSQNAGPLPKRAATPRKSFRTASEYLIVPGGREALEKLTGVKIEFANESEALALIFDACLRDTTTLWRLIRFYDKYPDFEKKMESKGVSIGGLFEIPAAGELLSEAAREALSFFGVREKNGRREVNRKTFDSRKLILEALGGNPEFLEEGKPTSIMLKRDDFSILLDMSRWVNWIKDGTKTRPDKRLLAFLNDERAMQYYVGLSLLPQEGAEWFVARITAGANAKDIAAGLYFVAPYLRFSQQGDLIIPGQSQGAGNWQRLIKADSINMAMQMLFKRDNWRLLYLFAALSSASEVGDFISRSPILFDQIYRAMKNPQISYNRESFDMIDLFSYIRVEDQKLRLPRSAEMWLGDRQGEEEFTAAILSEIGDVTAGKQIPLARKIAALDHIERERPDWFFNVGVIKTLAEQVDANRQAQIELALDLQMNWQQFENYLARVTRLDAISTLTIKRASIRVFQAAFELLRLVARNGQMDQAKVNEITNQLLDLDPGSELFAYDMLEVIKSRLSGVASSQSGQEVENNLIASLAGSRLFVLNNRKPDEEASNNSNNGSQDTPFYYFDASKSNQDRIVRALESQDHTRLYAIVYAVGALDTLENDPSDTNALERLKVAIEKFVEPEPPPEPKKGRSKQTVIEPPGLKDVVAQLTTPVDPKLIADVRFRVSPFVGEALLGQVYAAMIDPLEEPAQQYSAMVRNHDLGGDPWGEAEFDAARMLVRGNVARLGYALAQIESRSPVFGGPEYKRENSPASIFAESALASYRLVNHRWVTDRAIEYVARAIDLGEDALALSRLGDQAAENVVSRLEDFTSPRRAQVIRDWLNEAEIPKAIGAMSLSELYYLGRRYFRLKAENSLESDLINEPGALGAIARIVANSREESEQNMPNRLEREIRQFGMTTDTKTGMMRVDLRELEPYEYTLAFRDVRRLAERIQDFKLVLAHNCYRHGAAASVSLDITLFRETLSYVLNASNTSAGRTPLPERDWQDLLRAIRASDTNDFNILLSRMIQSLYARPMLERKWDEDIMR